MRFQSEQDRSNAPKVVGIDDWTWKRGHRYGTIICDLEQRRIVDILPDREAATFRPSRESGSDRRLEAPHKHAP